MQTVAEFDPVGSPGFNSERLEKGMPTFLAFIE